MEKILNNTIYPEEKSVIRNIVDNPIKVIFLDIDGVLNYDKWYVSKEYQVLQESENVELDIDPKCAERINNICNETGAKIVISSEWRLSWYGTTMRLVRGGINPEYILDKTPERIWVTIPGFDHSRGAEINDWLDFHPECKKYVIIDDRTDFKNNQQPYFVHVNPHIGLTDELMNKAINILKT
jgi:hypothetical protein